MPTRKHIPEKNGDKNYCTSCVSVSRKILRQHDGKTGATLTSAICTDCGLVQVVPLPEQQALETYYSQSYRQDYKKVDVPKLKHVWRAGNNALLRLPLLEKNTSPGARILDVGSGGGEFVALLKQRNYQPEGIEPNVGYGNFARSSYGLPIHLGMLDQVLQNLQPQSYDVITTFHVFEHVNRPATWLSQIHQLLKPGGVLILEVPNILHTRCAPNNFFSRRTCFIIRPIPCVPCWPVRASHGLILIPASRRASFVWRSEKSNSPMLIFMTAVLK